jgi:hypothetical protein
MGLLERICRTSAPTSSPCASLVGLGGTVAKSREFLNSYTSWVYACTSAIADELGFRWVMR